MGRVHRRVQNVARHSRSSAIRIAHFVADIAEAYWWLIDALTIHLMKPQFRDQAFTLLEGVGSIRPAVAARLRIQSAVA